MKRKLTITINSDWEDNLRHAAKAAEKGRYAGEQLNFTSPGLFFGSLTENRWALVHTLQGAGEVGVRELARRIGRDVRRVHDDAATLVELGLIEKTDKGKLVCPYVDIHVDMHMKAA